MWSVFEKQWFLICLAIALGVGFSLPDPFGVLADAPSLRSCIIAGVLFLTALTLETSALWKALTRPWPTLLAVALNYGLLPLAAWLTANQLLSGPFQMGVMIASVAPCTMASAAVWTRRAGGNDAIAVMVTVLTNSACFVMTPLWLAAMAAGKDVSIEVLPMVRKLALLVLLPMLVGQLLRQQTAMAEWATRQKQRLSITAQLGVLLIVFSGAIQIGLELSGQNAAALPIRDLSSMILVVSLIHTFGLVSGQLLGKACGFTNADWIAVGFAGSQKTLPVGLHVAALLGGGLMILPIVAYHVMQLLIDTIVADRLANRFSGE